MTKTVLSEDSLAILLLCSDLAMPSTANFKPFTLSEWKMLTGKLINSELQRPQAFFKAEDWRRILDLPAEQIVRIEKLLSRAGQLGIELERLNSIGVWVVTRADANYPLRLKKVLKQKAPVVLFGAGEENLIELDGICIVGSRDVDQNGADFTQTLANRCAKDNLTVISGGAKGVDSIAQQTALMAGGKVISILSDSLEAKIIKREYREAITAGNLLALSPFNPRSRFKVYTAMERNKYIYALSKYAVVVSSSVKKGGTWAGATENLKAGWVPLFVRAGNEIPDGNKMLLGLGGIALDAEILKCSTSLKEWFKVQSDSVNEALPEQVSLLKEDSAEFYSDLSSFTSAWPYLEKALFNPKNYKELEELFKVPASRIKKWLKQALEEGKVKKITKIPARFVSVNSEHETNFEQKTIYDLEVDSEN